MNVIPDDRLSNTSSLKYMMNNDDKLGMKLIEN